MESDKECWQCLYLIWSSYISELVWWCEKWNLFLSALKIDWTHRYAQSEMRDSSPSFNVCCMSNEMNWNEINFLKNIVHNLGLSDYHQYIIAKEEPDQICIRDQLCKEINIYLIELNWIWLRERNVFIAENLSPQTQCLKSRWCSDAFNRRRNFRCCLVYYLFFNQWCRKCIKYKV